MVLGKLAVPGRPTIWVTVGQGPTALAVGAGGGCLDIFTLIYPFFPLSPFFWETARYRLKYCLKGPLNPKQPTNQPIFFILYRKKLSRYAGSEYHHTHNYVAKSYIDEVEREVYFQDVKLQMDAKLWGEEYSRHNPPKKVTHG